MVANDILGRHVGEWVALANGRVLVADPDPAVVVAWLREHEVRAEQIFRVPGSDRDIVSEQALSVRDDGR